MKLAYGALVFALTAELAQAGTTVTRCWDHTFAYNEFTFGCSGAVCELMVEGSGAEGAAMEVQVYGGVIPVLHWESPDSHVYIRFPRAACQLDPKHLAGQCNLSFKTPERGNMVVERHILDEIDVEILSIYSTPYLLNLSFAFNKEKTSPDGAFFSVKLTQEDREPQDWTIHLVAGPSSCYELDRPSTIFPKKVADYFY